MMQSLLPLAVVVISFVAISLQIAPYVYVASKTVIDEVFHLPQGLAYCYGEFNRWDPKITTLPGLYLVSALVCGNLGKCSVYCLRLINIFAAGFNLILIYKLRTILHKEKSSKSIFNALNISLLPPLFFFSQLYYTDVLSLTSVLALLIYGLQGYYFAASCFGVASIMMRQTNILYVVFIMAYRGTGLIYNNIFKVTRFNNYKYEISHEDFVQFLRKPKEHFQRFFEGINTLSLAIPLEILSYNSVILFFVVFATLNGGIVVGDRTAHPTTLHLMQFLYFSLFTLFFGFVHYLNHIPSFIKNCHKHLILCAIAIFAISMLIYSNTIVHPYLLADNRHYLFYIWKRFFNTLPLRLLWSPLYFFSLFVISQKSYNFKDIRFCFLFVPIGLLGLCFQGLIELRYFLTPYVVLRSYFNNVSYKLLIVEFIFYLVINYITFQLFFTKEIIWTDFKDIQRLIW